MSDPVKPKLSDIRAVHDWCTVSKPLVAALDAVLALHAPVTVDDPRTGFGKSVECPRCSREYDVEDWPCPTVQAIAEHVDLEVPDA